MPDAVGVAARLPRLPALVASRPAAASLGAGVLAGLGHVPFSLVPLALGGLALSLILLDRARSTRAAFLAGWLTGTGYFATTLHWIVEPFLVDVGRHGWMAPFALVFIATGLALFWGAAFGAARWLGRSGWPLAFAWATALAVAEMLRGYVLTGFPWALVGYVWTEGPAIQLASVTGAFGLTFLTLALVAVAVRLSQRPGPAWKAVLALPWLLPLGAGWLMLEPSTVMPEEPAVVRLVQPNAPQHRKWDPDWVPLYFDRQLDYTRAPGKPDLIVWPETAVPFLLEDGHPALARIAEAAGDTPLVLGGQRVEGLRAFNSLILTGDDGGVAALYDKHHLVPFGEYIPFGQLARLAGLRSFAARDGYGYTPGPGPALLDLGPLGQVLPLICYEAIFPQDVTGAPRRPDWMLQITNDAWFGTFSGPYQHLAQARVRAVEQGVPMLRVANTGVSAVIDAQGRITASLPLGEAGFLDARLPAARPPTLYARTGDWATLGVLLLAFASLLASRRRERR
ncbi:apolipoprotein N-acyltransferase [Tranquillimonas alkanivorans]|uniref:Apolipoprotein N-acyltransferase n=1 Tax=Tranquillimonas alkanivorans TaxID=441119 RepID=A0A1I5KQM6_9RHOB|nr:apolipoprotein N-acyltransferase [Tranquillimonas alkanivorans]SFO87399.1 Apolipoprotein N-acyltransferase [Tranquillimonas alkanivorans]